MIFFDIHFLIFDFSALENMGDELYLPMLHSWRVFFYFWSAWNCFLSDVKAGVVSDYYVV